MACNAIVGEELGKGDRETTWTAKTFDPYLRAIDNA